MATESAIPHAHGDSIHAIARLFAVPDREISLAPRQGQVNLTILLGSEFVLRLPRKRALEGRLAKEAEIIPFVVDRGIPTSRLVSFDASHTIADVNYIVLEQLHGRRMDDLPSPAKGGSRTYASLFEIVSSLHSLQRDSVPPIRGVPTAEFDSEELLDGLTSSGEIGGNQAAWLRRWFRHLEDQGARSSDPVLLHGDVMPSNLIMNNAGEVTAIIDWGSACWGEPARDLGSLRPATLPAVVDLYRNAAGSCQSASVLTSLEASVLWYQLFFALARLSGRQSTSETRNWSAPRGARLLEIMRFLSSTVPDRWRRLLPEE